MVEHAPVEPSFNLLLQPLKTPRLVLVPVRDVDASWLQTMMELREVNSTTLIIPTPCPQGFAQGWIETAHRNNLSGNSYTFAVMLGDVPIGAIFLILNAAHAHAELGYFLEPSYWNRGYGSEASAAMLRFAFGDLHLNRVFAVYFSSNPASGRVMQKAGMVYEGCRRKHVRKCGVFFDLEQYGILRDEWREKAGRQEPRCVAEGEIGEHYGKFYTRRNPDKVYPVEFVVRTLLGTYPGLEIDKTSYRGSKVLDLGFGDGRNMPLLHDLGFEIYGVEISEEICALTRERMERLGVPAVLKTGTNAHIPFADESFDLVLACHACYYVSAGETFEDNLIEICRVLRPGGRFLFSLAKTDSYVLKDAVPVGNGHYRITGDPHGVRNGAIFRAFGSRKEVAEELGGRFRDLAMGVCENDYYGIYERVWIGTGLKR